MDNNNLEIEAKIKVNSLKDVEDKLLDLSTALYVGELHQVDYYFQNTKEAAVWIRLRKQRSGLFETLFLTFKGLKEKSIYKKRKEFEVKLEIDQFDTMFKLLLALGFEQNLSGAKTREVWTFNDCEIALDTLPRLGTFVEIEGPNEAAIAFVQESLGLINEPIIKDGYRTLMENKND